MSSPSVRIPRLGVDVEVSTDDGGPLGEGHRRALASVSEWGDDLLTELEAASFRYYRDFSEYVGLEEPVIASPEAVWEHIEPLGAIFIASAESEHAYVSVEFNCTWEEEHGMEWVVRDDQTPIWVGPYEGYYPHSGEADRGYLDPEYGI